jgi:hypothetical protein
MKNKLIYAGIIAVLFIAAMAFFNKTTTLGEIILAFVGAGSTIGYVWKWITVSEVKKEEIKKRESLVAENRTLRNDLEIAKG